MRDHELMDFIAAVQAERFHRRRLLQGGAALAGAGLLGGSLGPLGRVAAQDASPVPGAPQAGGTLSIAFEANPDNLNPFTMSSLVSALVVEQVYDTLFVFDENLASQPNLCVGFDAPDSTTYVFHLVENAMFSDGTPLTAEDVKFSLEAYKDPEIGARSWASRIDTIEAVDDYTV